MRKQFSRGSSVFDFPVLYLGVSSSSFMCSFCCYPTNGIHSVAFTRQCLELCSLGLVARGVGGGEIVEGPSNGDCGGSEDTRAKHQWGKIGKERRN